MALALAKKKKKKKAKPAGKKFNLTPAEARATWVAALRSGEFVQTSGKLKEDYKNGCRHCALGVACEMFMDYEPEHGLIEDDQHNFNNQSGSLPIIVGKWLGLAVPSGSGSFKVTNDVAKKVTFGEWWFKKRVGEEPEDDAQFKISIPGINDDFKDSGDPGLRFDQIADLIEAEPEGMFA